MKKKTIAIAAGIFAVVLIVVMIMNKPKPQDTDPAAENTISRNNTSSENPMPEIEEPTSSIETEEATTTTYVAPRVSPSTETTTAILDMDDMPDFFPVTADDKAYIGKWECTYMTFNGKTTSDVQGIPLYKMFHIEIQRDNKLTLYTLVGDDAMQGDNATWEYIPDTGELYATRNDDADTMLLSINQDGSLIMRVDADSDEYLYFRKVNQYTNFDMTEIIDEMYGDLLD